MAGAEPLNRRRLLAGLAAGSLAGPALAQTTTPAPPRLSLGGRYRQGGFVIGLTEPGAEVRLGDEIVGPPSAAGYVFIGLDRDAAPDAVIQVTTPTGTAERTVPVMAGDFDVQRIDGLPEDQVTPTDPALLERIRQEADRKAEALASRLDADHFRDGFSMPLATWRLSGRFGGQRILNGVPKRPHYGADLAAATGTPIHAPAAGLVVMAASGMHFEGGLTMIDHGQGLISIYLHQSRIDVEAGQMVTPGQTIGAVGMTGRATGPHLCWRLSWRGRHLDPMLMVGAQPPRSG